ncbi:DHA2 family efflux MFS transporter permease subunit [Martelella soudanensis]|uniref:DHA2 family efflux MFS transporter permease subunit n=1 Tax=unclassified Martelella TaxID=2629616 RepID=UPI0015DF4FE5|nr:MULTISPECIES: DHA2 family efflux MFS transporter permease subunit [unclassified Martelella]
MGTSRRNGSASTARTIILICVMMATLMQTLDTTIVNVALPYIQGSLAASPDQITWILTSYIVVAAIMTPPVGWLSARFGRRMVFLTSIIGFTVSSMLCGAATSLTEIVLFRAVQGVFGASIVPLSQATVIDIFPPEQRGQALSLWVMGVVVGPVLGPTLGGYLTDLYNWRWVFYINLPFGILAFLGLRFFLEDSERDSGRRFDWTGLAVLGMALATLQLMLDRGQMKDWFGSTEIIVYAVLCGLGFYLFLVHFLLARDPLIPPQLFRDVNFSSGLLMIFVVGMLILATSALLAPYLQVLAGRSVIDTGLLLAPRGAGTMAGVLLAGRLSNRVDPRIQMFVGIVLIALTLWQMTGWTPDIDARTFTVNSIIQGFGLGIVFTPLQVVSFATLPAKLRTDGTALFSLARNIGLAIGVSLTSVVLIQETQVLHTQIASNLTPFNRNLQQGGAYLFWNPTTPSGLAALNGEVTRQASIIAYVDDFKLLFIVSLLMLPLLALMRGGPKKETANGPELIAD